MAAEWFDPNVYAWIPGTMLGCVGGLLGGIGGAMASVGKAKRTVMGLWDLTTLCCAILLAAGVYAIIQKQPWGIWYGIGFPGLLGTVLFSALRTVLVKAYRQSEERSMAAQDL
jgi:hypothetical protein